MPTLPTREDVSVRLPSQGPRGVILQGDGGFFQSVGNALGAVQNIATEKLAADEEANIALAETSLMIGREKLIASLDDDEFDTYEKRYQEGMTNVRKEAAGLIKSPRGKQMFENQATLFHERGLIDLQARAKGKERDVRRGQFENSLAGLREVALTSNDFTGAIEQANELITKNIKAGYLGDEEGEGVRRTFAQSVAIGKLEMMPSQEQEYWLENAPESALIPADVKAKLLKAAKEANLDLRAMAHADRFMGDSLSASLSAARANIKDPKELRATMSEIEFRYRVKEAEEREFDDNMSETIRMAIETSDPKARLDAVLTKEQMDWARAKGYVANYEARQAQRLQGTAIQTDPETYRVLLEKFSIAADPTNPRQQEVQKEIAKMDMVGQYGSLLDDNALSQFTNARLAIVAPKPEKLTQIGGDSNILKRYAFPMLSYETTDKDKVTGKQAIYERLYYDTVSTMENQRNAPLTQEEKKTVITQLNQDWARGEMRGIFGGSPGLYASGGLAGVMAFNKMQGSGAGIFDFYELDSQISIEERAGIVSAFRKTEKREPTPLEILEWFAEKNGYKPNLEER